MSSTNTKNVTEIGVKSQLARLLATENIRIEHRPGVPTAAFDIVNRLLILPVWQNISEDLYDMLLLHETAHAIDTPATQWLEEIKRIAKKHHKNSVHSKLAEAAVKDFMNVIEDARIDKRQKRRYPGGKRNYVKGMAELHERDFFGIKESGKNIDEMSFIDRINIYFKGGSTFGIKFTDKEQEYLKRIEDAETFDEVIQLTDELYEKARLDQEEMQSKMKVSLVLTDSDGDGEDDDINPDDLKDFDNVEIIDAREGEGEGEDTSSETDGNDDKEGKSDKSGKEAKGESDGSDANSEKKGKKKGKITPYAHKVDETYASKPPAIDDYIPQVSTELAAAEKAKEIILDIDAHYVYVNTPRFNLDNIVDDYQKVIPQMEQSLLIMNKEDRRRYLQNFRTWKNQEKDTISFMVKEFEMRKAADTYSRINIAKTGVLDTNKLFSYKYNDDIFRRVATVPEGKNHGFVMILDWSGSMHGDLKHTMKQLFSLALFCKRVQIPFEVYLFRDAVTYHDQGCFNVWNLDTGSLHFKTFKMRNILSSRMNLNMLNRAMECLWLAGYTHLSSDPMNGTPLNQALLVSHEIVNNFQKKNRVQVVSTIILTDGGSDSCLGIINEKATPNKSGGTKYFLRDHLTSKVYPLNTHPRSLYTDGTYIFTEILKERTNSNLVGFYLFNGSYSSLAYHMSEDIVNKQETNKKWTEEGFVTCYTAGYDEYHILNVKKFGESKNELKVTGSMTQAAAVQAAAVKAFTKFSEKKMINRSLLTTFIKRISDFKKNAA